MPLHRRRFLQASAAAAAFPAPALAQAFPAKPIRFVCGFAPGTPPDIVARLSTEFQKLFSEPKFVEFLDKQAVVAAPTSPEGFAEFLKKDRKDAETLIKIANTKKTEFKE